MLANAASVRQDWAVDFEAAGLLNGLEGEERTERERLLRELADAGFTLAEMQAALAEDRLVLLPVQRVLGASHTAREIEERTGVPATLMLRIRRLAGLPQAAPDDRVFGDEDIALGQSTRLFLESGLPEDGIVEITRVLGECMARVAATTTAAFADAFLRPGDTETEVAVRFAALAERLLPELTPVFAAAFKAHLREGVQRAVIGRAQLQSGQVPNSAEVAVCFADLVGFTRLGGEVEAQELGSVAGTLARLANEATVSPTRLVKTIGDAALFVSPEPAALVGVALSLVDAVERADLPSLRAGIAFGPALIRAGDFYGHSVNLASRVTGVARPGTVLGTEAVRDAAAEQFEWSFAGRHRFKGVDEPVPLYRARSLRSGEAEPPRKRPADRRRRRASS